MNYQERFAAARRLTLLLGLYFAPQYTLPRPALRDYAGKIGYPMSHDLVATEISWLAEQGLVEPLEMDVVRLTDRGEDVATGRSQNPGVRRPSPGESNGT